MAEIVAYGIVGSPYLRAALLGFEEKGVPYKVVPLAPPETKAPAHLARQPFGRVPAVTHGDFALYETQAILRYTDTVFPGIALRPIDPRTTARMDQMVGIVDWYFFREIGVTIVFNRVVAPAFGMPCNEAAIEAAIPKAKICLAALDGFIGDGPYVVGDQLTIADLMLAPQMDMLGVTPEAADLLAPHPNLKAWLGRMQERPSMQNTTWERLRAAA
jgi:glutathione S-transferase